MTRTAFYLIFFMSGAAGLGYEMLWTRMLVAGLGHEMVSVLGVVSAFFSGLALGAWVLDGPVSRSAAPGKWYALLEIIIGLWALVLVAVLPDVNRWVSGMIGLTPTPVWHWSIAFLYPFVVLLPATAAMGATLPAMDRLLERVKGDSRSVAGLYCINTFGAVSGILLVTFIVLPALGMNRTSLILACANFIGAAAVIVVARPKKTAETTATETVSAIPGSLHFYFILFITGLLGIGFEVMMARALSQILENTVYSFAAILMAFLFGTAAGAGIYQNFRRPSDPQSTLSLLLVATAAFCSMAIGGLPYVEPLFRSLRSLFGDGFSGAVTAEISIALILLFLPAAAMGATFSHLAQSLRHQRGGVGKALCLNTLGGALGPFLFGVMLLPAVGLHYAMLSIPTAYLLCFPRRRIAYATATGLFVFTTFLIGQDSDRYRFVSLAEGEALVSHREGVMAAVSVVKDSRGGLHLTVNNHFQMGGTTSVFSDRRQAYLPLLLHPAPQDALFLGIGTGITFAAAADFPGLNAEGVELLPEVISAMDYFESVTGDFRGNNNLRIINADARRYVSATDKRYDVVVADLFHPSRDGAGSLYTVEHFAAIRELLTEKGVFCQWLPLYQLNLETFKVIVKTFLHVFPEGQAYIAHYGIEQPIVGLLGGRRALRFPEKWYRKRLPDRQFRRHMAGYGYDSVYSLLGTFIAGSEALTRFAGGCPLNTDDRPVVLFEAPRFVYRKSEPAPRRLLALLEAFSPADPESILAAAVTEEDHFARPRLARYWNARDRFLKLGTRIERTSDVTQLYAKVSGPLLEVVRESVDFSAAYFPLISIAYDIYPYDQEASHRLLGKLERANPMRPEARILRQRLFANSALSHGKE